MLYIVTNNGNEYSRHIQDDLPKLEKGEWVLEIQADGHELAVILQQIEGIPNAPQQRVVRWFGDHAQFIYANLKLPIPVSDLFKG